MAASESKAQEELKALLKDIGVEAEGITDKSLNVMSDQDDGGESDGGGGGLAWTVAVGRNAN
jgi:hypothetical protein